MSDRFRGALTDAWKRIEERQWIYGKPGKLNVDTSYTYAVPGRSKFIYVTIRNAGGAQTAVPARNDALVPLNNTTVVKMRLEKGVYVIHGVSGRPEQGGSLPENVGGNYSFLELTDVPADYTGAAGNLLVVNGTEDGVEFTPLLGAEDTPLDADKHVFWDVVDGILKTITHTNLLATLKTYFDTLYVALTGNQTVAGIKTWSDAAGFGGAPGPNHAIDVQPGAKVVAARFRAGNTGIAYNQFTPADASSEWANFASQSTHLVFAHNTGYLQFVANATERMRILANGNIGIGVTVAQGKLHIHDGTGGKLFVTKTGIDGTAQTIIPDGTGDVTGLAFVSAVGVDNGGNLGQRPPTLVVPGGSTTVATVANTATITVNANGSVTIQRTVGTGTMAVTIDMFWQ